MKHLDLTPLQVGMLFQHETSPRAGVNVQQLLLRSSLLPDAHALKTAWQTLMRRHAGLRASVAWVAGSRPQWQVHADLDVPITSVPLTSCDEAEFGRQLEEFLQRDRARGIDPHGLPPWRLTALYGNAGQRCLVWTSHHLLMDGLSYDVLMRELAQLLSLESLPADVDDTTWPGHVHRQAARDKVAAHQFWMQVFGGFHANTPAPLSGAVDASRPATSGRVAVRLDGAERQALAEIRKAGTATLQTVVLLAWSLVLSRYADLPDVAFAVTRSQRRFDQPGERDSVGLYIATIPFRWRLDDSRTASAALIELRDAWRTAQPHDHLGLSDIAASLACGSASDWLKTLVVVDTESFEERLPKTHAFWHGADFRLFQRTGFAVAAHGYGGEQPSLEIEYDPTALNEAGARQLLSHLHRAVHALLSQPDGCLGDISLMADDEWRHLVRDRNKTSMDYDPCCTVDQFFTAQVARTPDATALLCKDEAFSYAALDLRVEQAAQLLSERGVGSGDRLGIHMTRGAPLLIWLLATSRVGAAYVPLDPLFPPERIAMMIEDAALRLIVTNLADTSHLPLDMPVLRVDEAQAWQPAPTPRPRDLDDRPAADSLAYILYTSGSTGKPKGVPITVRNLANFLVAMQALLQLGDADVLVAVTTISFDIAGLELFLPLSCGAAVALADTAQASDGHLLAAWMGTSNATVLQATPVTWRMLLAAGWHGRSGLKALCGGEAMGRDLAQKLRPRVGQLWNVYGPTETTIWSTAYHLVDDLDVVPIGLPIGNTQIYVLDAAGRPMPPGATGEIFIGGDGVARGYWRRPDLTAQRFVPDPFQVQVGGTLYRTGDLGRWNAQGLLECLGRSDGQVKIRGHRIELGEIEFALMQHASVQAAAVVPCVAKSGERVLVAHLQMKTALIDPDGEALRLHLRQTLPDYMVPNWFIRSDAFPLTPNGKVDRNALMAQPLPERVTSDASQAERPASDTEQRMQELWRQAFGHADITVHSDFFALGGHSLMAIQLVSDIASSFGVQLTINALYEASTVEALARLVERQLPTGGGMALARMIRMSSDTGKPPIFWVPGGRGVSLLGLRGLACQLDGYSAFGIEYRAGGQGHGFLDVPTRAAEFVRLMREQQPAGPYRLAGFCLGGLVAWEAARLLSEDGAQIEALLLINSYVPRFKRSMSSQVAHRMRRLRAVQAASGWAGVLRGLTSAMRQRVRVQTEGREGLPGTDGAAEELNMNAMNQFRPGPLNVPTIIIGAQDTDDLRGAPLHADPRFGWLALASGPQAFELIPGDHLSVLEAPYLDRLVHAVRSRLPSPPASASGPAHDPGT